MDFIREPRVGERRQQVYVTSSADLQYQSIMPIPASMQNHANRWPCSSKANLLACLPSD